MTLDEYFRSKNALTPIELAEVSGVSYKTIKSVWRGMKLRRNDIAVAISAATKNKVTVLELLG